MSLRNNPTLNEISCSGELNPRDISLEDTINAITDHDLFSLIFPEGIKEDNSPEEIIAETVNTCAFLLWNHLRPPISDGEINTGEYIGKMYLSPESKLNREVKYIYDIEVIHEGTNSLLALRFIRYLDENSRYAFELEMNDELKTKMLSSEGIKELLCKTQAIIQA